LFVWSRLHIPLVFTNYTLQLAVVDEELQILPGFSDVHVTQSLVFCVVFCEPLFVITRVVSSTLTFYGRREISLKYTRYVHMMRL
jgi:hypothetical protein